MSGETKSWANPQNMMIHAAGALTAAGVPTRPEPAVEIPPPRSEHHVEAGGVTELFVVAASVLAIVDYYIQRSRS